MEAPKTNPQPKLSPQAPTPWYPHKNYLVYFLGCLLVVSNLYYFSTTNFVARISYLVGGVTECFTASCPAKVSVLLVSGINVLLPTLLFAIGISLLIIKRRFLAELAAIISLAEICLTFVPYLKYSIIALLILIPRPYYASLIAIFILSIACSNTLPPPSLSSQLRITKKGLKVIGIATSILALSGAIYFPYTFASIQDTNTVQKIQTSASLLTRAITKNNDSSAVEKSTKASHISVSYTPTGFNLCGSFFIDRSHGAPKRALYSPNDISEHKSGRQCFRFTAIRPQARKDTQIYKNMIVTKTIPSKLSVAPRYSGYGFDLSDISHAKTYLKDGIQTDRPLKLGDLISIYYETNIHGSSQIYKLVFETPGVYPELCTDLLKEVQPRSTSACPETITNVKISLNDIMDKTIRATTPAGKTVHASWDSFYNPDILYPEPVLYSSGGTKIPLSRLQEGDRVDLTYDSYTDLVLREVHIR